MEIKRKILFLFLALNTSSNVEADCIPLKLFQDLNTIKQNSTLCRPILEEWIAFAYENYSFQMFVGTLRELDWKIVPIINLFLPGNEISQGKYLACNLCIDFKHIFKSDLKYILDNKSGRCEAQVFSKIRRILWKAALQVYQNQDAPHKKSNRLKEPWVWPFLNNAEIEEPKHLRLNVLLIRSLVSLVNVLQVPLLNGSIKFQNYPSTLQGYFLSTVDISGKWEIINNPSLLQFSFKNDLTSIKVVEGHFFYSNQRELKFVVSQSPKDSFPTLIEINGLKLFFPMQLTDMLIIVKFEGIDFNVTNFERMMPEKFGDNFLITNYLIENNSKSGIVVQAKLGSNIEFLSKALANHTVEYRFVLNLPPSII